MFVMSMCPAKLLSKVVIMTASSRRFLESRRKFLGFEGRLGCVYPQPIVLAAALVDVEVSQGGPGCYEAGADAGWVYRVHRLSQVALQLESDSPAFLRVALHTAFLNP